MDHFKKYWWVYLIGLILIWILFIRKNDKGETVINVFGSSTPATGTTGATGTTNQRHAPITTEPTVASASLKYGSDCGITGPSGEHLFWNGYACVSGDKFPGGIPPAV